MTKVKSINVISIGFQFIVMIVLIMVILNWYKKKPDSLLKDDLKEYVGEDIIIKDEPYMIVDYSLINRTFTLDDGRKVSVELILKEETKTEY